MQFDSQGNLVVADSMRGLLSVSADGKVIRSFDSETVPAQAKARIYFAETWLGKPKALPGWLKQEDLDYLVAEFSEAGFRGGVNYYRNMDRNWETTPQQAMRPCRFMLKRQASRISPPTLSK